MKKQVSVYLVAGLMAFLGLFFVFYSLFNSSSEGFTQKTSEVIEIESAVDVGPFIDEIPKVSLLLLGESTHGTSEYYRARAAISKEMIKNRDVGFVAVEGDWATLGQLNYYILGKSQADSADEIALTFSRWPEWMWANSEVTSFIEWLKKYNEGVSEDQRVHFVGMDVYGQWQSLDRLLESSILDEYNLLDQVSTNSECFARFRPDEWAYARAVLYEDYDYQSCIEKLEGIVQSIYKIIDKKDRVSFELFDLLQNAYVLKNSEKFYRLAAMERGGAESWNSRVQHMKSTINRLYEFHDQEMGIVWAHNTHIGDARATEMVDREQVNIGQLTRQTYGSDNVFLIGFSTYKGRVHAGDQWGSSRIDMEVPKAIEGSYDQILENLGHKNFFIKFNKRNKEAYSAMKGHRAIGVVYNSQAEAGNYVSTSLWSRYDGLIFFRETTVLDALH